MNYSQAMKELNNKNKVRSVNWEEDTFLYKGKDGDIFKVIKSQNREFKFSILDLKEEDINNTWVFHVSKLLTKSEHDSLTSLIECFKYYISSIKKRKVSDTHFKLVITFDLGKCNFWDYMDGHSYRILSLDFPNKEDKYEGLELNKEYTLNDLELIQDIKKPESNLIFC